MIGTFYSIVSTPSGSTFLDLVLPFRWLKVCSKTCWSFSMKLPLFPLHPWLLFNKLYVYFPFAYVVGVVFIVVNLYLVLRCDILLVHSWLACCSSYLLWGTLSITSALGPKLILQKVGVVCSNPTKGVLFFILYTNLENKKWVRTSKKQKACVFRTLIQVMKSKNLFKSLSILSFHLQCCVG